MKKTSNYIYSALFIILLGIGDDSAKFIKSEYVLLTGALILVYGIFLHFKQNSKISIKITDTKIDYKKIPSKVYILIGIVLLRMDRFSSYIDEYEEPRIFLMIVGMACASYGVNLLLKERNEKARGGNIE